MLNLGDLPLFCDKQKLIQMKTTYLSMLSLFVVALTFAQEKNKLQEGVAHQTTIFHSSNISKAEALATFAKTYKLDGNNTFQAYRTSTDRLGVTHERHQQYYRGIKVQFGSVITHSKDGQVLSTNGELYNTNALEITPSITRNEGFAKALSFTNASSYLWEDSAQAQLVEYTQPEGELVVFPNVNAGTIHLAYMYDVYATAPISRNEIFVDANTGDILYVNPIIKHADRILSSEEVSAKNKAVENAMNTMLAPGTADTRYSGTRPIEATQIGSDWVLLDETRGDGIVTWNCEAMFGYQDVHFTDNDNVWSAAEHANALKDDGALDAHWGAIATYDFWMENFQRDSYDDNGAKINSYVHYDNNNTAGGYDNAFWNGRFMTYGDGNNFDILTALDVCGHEIGHAVCSFTADLAYQNQSGGMNEGYSDIWGACVEQYGRTGSIDGELAAGVWLIGEDIGANNVPLRSMSDPNERGDPDTYQGTNWVMTGDEGACVPDGTVNDYCGVHTNSGVLNHWFYLLTVGGTGTNNATNILDRDDYDVTGIGMRKAAEIAYLTERDFLTANSTLADARVASIAVASSLYCANGQETISVTDAWNAVNVGGAYQEQPNDASLVSVTNMTSVSCDVAPGSFVPELTIVNGGTEMLGDVEITYSIDGGSETTLTETLNLDVCGSAAVPVDIGVLGRGAHTIDFEVTTENDALASNNEKSITVVFNDAGEIGVENPFTSADDVLVAFNASGSSTPLWERGTPVGVFLGPSATSSTVYGTNLDGNHPDKTIALLVSQCYDLSSTENAFVSFDMAFDLETDWDFITFQYSIDGGQTFEILGTSEDDNWFNNSRIAGDGLGENCYNCLGAQWTGMGEEIHDDGLPNGTMRTYTHTLADFDATGSGETNVIFRFFFQSDDATNEEGVIIDNFLVDGEEVLSVENNEFEGLSIYPNPSSGLVNIAGSDIENANVSIVDLSGRIITKNAGTTNGTSIQVNIENLASGAYFMVIENDTNKSVRQIIKN